MRKEKLGIVILLSLSVLTFVGITAKADDVTSPNIKVLPNGEVKLSAPKSAEKVITNDDKQVKYQVDSAIDLQNVTTGTNFTAPITVDSQIVSNDGTTTKGTTTITTDLSQAEVVNENNDLGVNFGSIAWQNIFGTKVFANSQNQNVSDKTYSISFRLNISWTVSNGYAGLTTVSGGYGTAVDKVYVSASSVTTSTSGQIKGTSGYSQQVNGKNMGISSSWTITRNYKPVKVPASGALVGATYYATLKRGNDTWKFQTTNRAY